MTDIHCVAGAYDTERDHEGEFCWLSNRVEIQVAGLEGVLVLAGQSPVAGHAVVRTAQATINVRLTPGTVTITIPVRTHGNLQTVSIEFAQALHAPEDVRTLSFKARSLSLRLPGRQGDSGADATLVLGRGLYAGAVSTTFAQGWLRMHTTLAAGGMLKVSGILVPPVNRREPAALTANGELLDEIRYGLFNPDYAYLGNVAFEGGVDLTRFSGQNGIRFSSVFTTNGKSATPEHQDWYWPMSRVDSPIPQAENMKRIGSSERDWFLFSGASFVEKLDDVVGIANRNDLHVLDWGCGCGRLTRHLIGKGYGRITGIDIDPVNVQWCQAHIPGAEFVLVSPDIPTPLPADSVDLIIGHSVFTHLTEVDQFLWLSELNRLLKPGGQALVTVMGSFSSAIDPFDVDSFMALQRDGFLDVGWQEDGVDSQKPGYYRRIFHTIDYVIRHWSAYFEVRAALEGYSDHQNAIVLRKLP
jgi:SAM-dependent methyltransferase